MLRLSVLFFIALSISCQGPSRAGDSSVTEDLPVRFGIAWYNVENLFDTKDDPRKHDEDFTPEGKLEWTQGRYEQKIKNLGRVIQAMDNGFGLPVIIGLAEVENTEVARDLAEFIAPGKYAALSHNSKDKRGIEVALLYDRSLFSLVADEAREIKFQERDYTSRDILYAQLKTNKNEHLHLFLNHWPSRRGGWKESEHRRISAAETLADLVSGLDAKEELIVIMGDFNDYPSNKSISEVLGAVQDDDSEVPGELINLAADLDMAGMGTYNYKGTWGMLDQIIVSEAVHNREGWKMNLTSIDIFKKDFMMYYDRKYKESKPSRTYGGERYYGGYSDHLPLIMRANNRTQ